MKILLTESQINGLVKDLVKNNEGDNYYSPDLNILSVNDFVYPESHPYAGIKSTRYIVGDEKPLGEFRIGHMMYVAPGFDLYDETPRNWHRCISMLGEVLKDFVNNRYKPSTIVFSPQGEMQRKRYQSNELIDFIMGYIGDVYSSQIDGTNTVFSLKRINEQVLSETRTEESLTKRSNILYKALKNGKFGFTFFDMVYDKLSVYTSEVLFKGIIEYSLPDDYTTELIKDEDTFRLGIKRSGYNHIRYYIKEEPEFRFTGKMKITNIDNDDEHEEEFTNEPIHNINHLSYHKINKRMNKFLEQHYNVTVKKTNNTYDNLNEGSHSTKELSKLMDWAMKKMDCYVVRTTKGIKICPPEHIKEPCYVAHFSDKAVRPLMAAISKWFGSTKYDVERAFRGNRPL
jgi:hypothetical protein